MVEIRVDDLRFTAEEASIYLLRHWAAASVPKHVAALEERTEGWIAALQLAALSMEGRDNIADFVAQFTGNDRYIVDYLVEEVLQRLPDEIRGFLLDTCILELAGEQSALPMQSRREKRRQGNAGRPRTPEPLRRFPLGDSVAGTVITICSPMSCRLISRASGRDVPQTYRRASR